MDQQDLNQYIRVQARCSLYIEGALRAEGEIFYARLGSVMIRPGGQGSHILDPNLAYSPVVQAHPGFAAQAVAVPGPVHDSERRAHLMPQSEMPAPGQPDVPQPPPDMHRDPNTGQVTMAPGAIQPAAIDPATGQPLIARDPDQTNIAPGAFETMPAAMRDMLAGAPPAQPPGQIGADGQVAMPQGAAPDGGPTAPPVDGMPSISPAPGRPTPELVPNPDPSGPAYIDRNAALEGVPKPPVAPPTAAQQAPPVPGQQPPMPGQQPIAPQHIPESVMPGAIPQGMAPPAPQSALPDGTQREGTDAAGTTGDRPVPPDGAYERPDAEDLFS